MTVENIKKVTSRKAEGAAQNNRNEVRALIEDAKRFAGGICVFKDVANNVIYIDTVQGISAQVIKVVNPVTGEDAVDYKWYEDGSNSKKANGYVYTPVVINGLKGKQEVFMCGTHTLVAMLAHTKEYDKLDEQGLTPLANHESNCSWNNRADNLGWCTTGLNNKPGMIVHSLHKYFRHYSTHIENNCSGVDFVVLDEKLTVDNIKSYLSSIGNDYEFKTADREYIEADVLNQFVDWLIDTGVWAGNTFEQQ